MFCFSLSLFLSDSYQEENCKLANPSQDSREELSLASWMTSRAGSIDLICIILGQLNFSPNELKCTATS